MYLVPASECLQPEQVYLLALSSFPGLVPTYLLPEYSELIEQLFLRTSLEPGTLCSHFECQYAGELASGQVVALRF